MTHFFVMDSRLVSSGVATLQFYGRSELTVKMGWGSHVRPLKNVNASLMIAGLV